MTQLLIIRDKIKEIYTKYDIVFYYLIKFIILLSMFTTIDKMTGYFPKVTGMLVVLGLSLVCLALPKGLIVVVGCALVVAQFYGLSMELAIITLVMFLIMTLIYFVFGAKTEYILFLVPVLFALKIPYLIPIVIGLTAGIAGIIPVVFGTYIYFSLDFSKEFAVTISSFEEDAFVQRITYIIDNTILSKEMLVMSIVFAAVIIIVYIIRRLSFDYSWIIAISVGSIMQAVLVVMSHIMLDIDFSMVTMIVGTILAIIIGMILYFFVFAVDYQRTERVQFEDDDFYYYVKAVPKFKMESTQVNVKKINSLKNEEVPFEMEKIDINLNDEEEKKRKLAYERDVENLEEEE